MIKRDNVLLTVSTCILSSDLPVLTLLTDKLEEFYEMLDLKDNTDINSDLFYYCFVDEEKYKPIDVEAITSVNRKTIKRFMDSCNDLILRMIANYIEYDSLKKLC